MVGDALWMEYTLTGTGWAEARISTDRRRADLTASYLSDALGNLLRAVAELKDGNAESRCSWDEEPGEFRWVFALGDDHRAVVSILEFDGLWGNEPDERGREIFAFSGSLRTLVRAVSVAAHAVLDRYGLAGYAERWHEHAFPLSELEDLDRFLALPK